MKSLVLTGLGKLKEGCQVECNIWLSNLKHCFTNRMDRRQRRGSGRDMKWNRTQTFERHLIFGKITKKWRMPLAEIQLKNIFVTLKK